ncbi:amidase 1-like isoform X3 [Diospyros lotus]|uniref:amidase 1-like isoform X3 n=1 Tax=Diospyros lotus TaxID=55363 RepID=UPI0022533B86|nr:amidase 1-like isoform X3 [Diospyros lotus]XP_052193158.1 amidase 1-like isoform X3 [Diospyros lotus]XP_052193160.1 amidase 1-like isoform X3 [Diospyros lotus]
MLSSSNLSLFLFPSPPASRLSSRRRPPLHPPSPPPLAADAHPSLYCCILPLRRLSSPETISCNLRNDLGTFRKLQKRPEKGFGPFFPFPKRETVRKRRNGVSEPFPCLRAMESDYGAFTEKITLEPYPSAGELPLKNLTFAVKDIFDVDGYVTGFGNPDWARTHSAATSTAPAILAVLRGGAKCVGKTVMDEMAYSINGDNKHYGTPKNPSAPDRVPGGSSSGSAVSVGATLVDFALGTDTGGSVRVPAAFCGILGFRPSHGAVSTTGVIPMAQSLDTVGWFARDAETLCQVGRVLLELPDVDPVKPSAIIIPEDCFQLLSIPSDRVTKVLVKSVEKLFGGQIMNYTSLGNYVKDNVPSLKHFMSKGYEDRENIPSLAALSSARRLLQRYEFKNNHGEWVRTIKPDLGPVISERVFEALRTADENIDVCHSVKTELREALSTLLGDFGILAIPTVPGPPPKLQTEPTTLEAFQARAFCLLSIAGMSGFCQVSLPLGKHNGLPVAVSLLAKHGSDGLLLNLVQMLYETLQEQIDIAEKSSP